MRHRRRGAARLHRALLQRHRVALHQSTGRRGGSEVPVHGLLGKQLLYTARQKDGVLTLDVPAEVATFRTTIEDMQTLQANGVKTLVLVTEKNTTTLNLSLLCEGQKSGTRVTLRHLGSNATLSVGLRCRRDLLIGR